MRTETGALPWHSIEQTERQLPGVNHKSLDREARAYESPGASGSRPPVSTRGRCLRGLVRDPVVDSAIRRVGTACYGRARPRSIAAPWTEATATVARVRRFSCDAPGRHRATIKTYAVSTRGARRRHSRAAGPGTPPRTIASDPTPVGAHREQRAHRFGYEVRDCIDALAPIVRDHREKSCAVAALGAKTASLEQRVCVVAALQFELLLLASPEPARRRRAACGIDEKP